MHLPFRPVSLRLRDRHVMGALVGGAVASALAVGCAMSSPADLTPDLDPSIPGLDAASSDPNPALGGGTKDGGASSSGKGSSADGGDPPSDGGGTKPSVAPDAAPSIALPSGGELLVTEIMYATFTPEPASEWLELHSLATANRSLSGLTLKDGGGRTHVIAPGLTIAPGAYVVLVRNKAAALSAKVPSSAVVYEYGTGLPDNAGIILANGATGGLSILNGTTVLAAAPYGGWYSQSGGSSVQLKVLDAAASPSKASWCLSLTTWTTGSEKGTPGGASDCP